jgi:hypothetical protein
MAITWSSTIITVLYFYVIPVFAVFNLSHHVVFVVFVLSLLVKLKNESEKENNVLLSLPDIALPIFYTTTVLC